MLKMQRRPKVGTKRLSRILYLSTEQNTMVEIGRWTSVLKGFLLSYEDIQLICIIHSSALAADYFKSAIEAAEGQHHRVLCFQHVKFHWAALWWLDK